MNFNCGCKNVKVKPECGCLGSVHFETYYNSESARYDVGQNLTENCGTIKVNSRYRFLKAETFDAAVNAINNAWK